MSGYHGSEHVTFKAIDGAGIEKILYDVQGDPSMGSRMHSNREGIDILVRGIQQGRLLGDESAIEVSWQSLKSDRTLDFADFCLAEGDYAAGGASPMVSTDPCGTPAVRLQIITAPPCGDPTIVEYARAYLSVSDDGGTPAVLSNTFACYGRSVL